MNEQNLKSKNNKPSRLKTLCITGIVIFAFLIAIYLIFAVTTSCTNKKSKLKDLNILSITLDTLRADYVSCYTKGNANTPNIDRIAQAGVIFEHCISQTPLTLPAHISVLTGTYPLYHQVRDNGGFQVPTELEFVSETLQAHGFVTAAFIGAYVLHSRWGVNQGFTNFSDDFDLDKYNDPESEIEKRADVVLKDAETWLKANGHKDKFFAWIHLYDPHIPYAPPPPYDTKYPDTPYRGEVEYMDEQLGKFFNFLEKEGLDKKTLIVITGDHGEGLWDHNESTHGIFIYESTVWVPLIIKAPFEFPVKRVKQIVEHVDIAPTLLEALDIPVISSYQGESLLGLLMGGKNRKKKVAYTESYYAQLYRGWSHLQAFYQDEWKYILAPSDELYQVKQDPGEQNNLSIRKSYVKKKMRDRLRRFVKANSKNAIKAKQLNNRSKEDLKILETLGYLTTFADNTGKSNLPDPKDMAHLSNEYAEAKRLMNSGRLDQSIALFKKIALEDPSTVDVYLHLASLYAMKNRYDIAAEYYYKTLELKPDYNSAMLNLIRVLLSGGKTDKAIQEAQRFLKMFPKDYSLLIELAAGYFSKGENQKALDALKKSIEIEDTNSQAFLCRGEIYLQQKDFDKAESSIKKAIEIYPQLESANYNLARVKEAQGDLNGAIKYYKKEFELHPHHLFAVFALAETLKKTGAYDQAIPYYRKAIEIEPNFKMPYFMIANYYLERNESLKEAVELCKIGIKLQPYDESTVSGYYLLTNLYDKLGDSTNSQFYKVQGEKLMRQLKH